MADFITPTGIPPAEAFGSTSVINTQVLAPIQIASEEAFGTPAINYISPTGIVSGEAFGSATVLLEQTLTLTGIASAEAFGTAVVADGGVVLRPTGIPGGEAFGTSTLAIVPPVAASGINKISTSLFGDLAFIEIQATVPCTEKLSWKTETSITHNGSESRNRLRSAPRQQLTFRFSEGVSFKSLAFLTEYGGLPETWAVPLWTEAQTLGALSSGQSSITAETLPYDFRDNSLALLYESTSKYEIIEIDAVSAGGFTLLSNTVNTYTNADLMPVRQGIIQNSVSKNNKGHAAVSRITYDITDNLALQGPASATQFLGSDAYTDAPLVLSAAQGYEQKVFTRVDKADYDVGSFDRRTPWANSRTRRPSYAVHEGASDIREFKKFLERRGGRHLEYWEPSFEPDLTITGEGAIGTVLQVINIGQEDWTSSRLHVAILDVCGGWYLREVTSVSVSVGVASLNIADLNLDVTAVAMVCYLGLKRFDTDAVEITWVGNNVITCNINTLEIAP